LPHIVAEYSCNLEDRLNVQTLVDDLHRAIVDSTIAEIVGIGMRAARREYFRVADGQPALAAQPIVAR